MEKIEKKRLDALRRVMAQQGIDCCIINSTDPHQSEIPAAHWRGREWMTGFKSENGTNGIAVVTKDRAYVWTDNRFFIQARQQLEGTGFEMMPLDGPEGVDLVEYIADMMPEDSVVAIDGMTFSSTDAEKMREAFEEAGLHFATDFPMFDYIWPDRPEQPLNRLFIHDEDIVGETVESKISRILTEVDKEGADAILISALDDIAWATNLRAAGDVVFSPMFLAYLYLDKEGSRILFINEKKLTEEVREFLKKYDIEIRGYDEVTRFAETLSPSSCVLIDPSLTSITIAEAIPTAIEGGKGVAKLKSVKNETMLAHWRTAMEKDGVALVKLFKWIDEEFPAGKLTEMSIARKLRECRLADPDCVDESFAAIVGWNSHGAIVHYEPSDETDVPVTGQGLLLIDSGGQYTHGTTDITRTVALGGEPTAEQKHDFTLVLKGMIALAMAKFPKGTRGAQLDILARRYLWSEGKAYYHGTGHGVGFFINCHEGPAQIRMNDIPVPLEPGMVMSDEPGLYIEGKYGIRCENMLAVEHWKNNEFGEFYRFRNLTLFPFDRNLIEWEIITPEEKRWLESYNKEIIERLSPLLDADEKKWLESKING